MKPFDIYLMTTFIAVNSVVIYHFDIHGELLVFLLKLVARHE